MAELICQANLTRNLRVSGCVQWAPHSSCLLASVEGMAVVELKLPGRKNAKVEIHCSSIEPYLDVIEPKVIDRDQLITELGREAELIQKMKVDRVVSPSLRSMGDHLNIRQSCWELDPGKSHRRLAVLAQQLLVYSYINHQWLETANLSDILSGYLDEHPIANNTGDVNEVFKVHCRYIRLMTWGQPTIFVVNNYGHVFAIVCPSCSGEKPKVHRVEISTCTKCINSLTWISSHDGADTLVIGRNNGTCSLVNLTKNFETNYSLDLTLEADYRPIECLHRVSEYEIIFIKHTEVFLYNFKRDVMQSYGVTETKYTLNHATADSTNIYIATSDSGLLVKNRANGETCQQLPALSNHSVHGVALSAGGTFLLALSQPIISDLYINRKPLAIQIFQLNPADKYLKDLWESSVVSDICWDTFIVIGDHMADLPDWLTQVMDTDGIDGWSTLTPVQARLLYVAYHCLVEKYVDPAICVSDRLLRLSKLKLLLTVQHMENTQPTSDSALQYIEHTKNLYKSDPSIWDISYVPHRHCIICENELKLNSNLQYECNEGHCFQACSNTLLPILSLAPDRCRQCSAAIVEIDSVDGGLTTLVSDTCAYCGGARKVANKILL